MANDNTPESSAAQSTETTAQEPSSLVDTVATAKADPAPAAEAPKAGEQTPAAPPAWQASAVPTEFMGGKYKTLGDVEKSVKELQKSYTEAQTKLKAFAGAPEKYELAMPEELKGQMEWKADDPLLGEFQSICKENGVSQEFFGKCLGMLAKYDLANQMPDWAREKELIGERADERIASLTSWYGANVDPEGSDLIKRALGVNPTPGEVFLAMERIIKGKRQPAVNKPGDDVAGAPTVEDINRKYRTPDPVTKKALIDTEEGRQRYRAELANVVGQGEHRVVVGRQ